MWKNAVFRFVPFSKRQRMVLNWWTDGSRYKDWDGIIADGAIRSGKTMCMSLSFVMWAMSSFNGQNLGMAGKTIGAFRRNVLFWLKIMLRTRGYTVVDHRADNLVTIRRGTTENYFYIFGGKDERSQDLIQGITLAGLFLDEVALMPESFVEQAVGRCSVEGARFWFNCNPAGPFHWFKTGWIDRRKERRLLYLHFTMEDNNSLSEATRERYRRQHSGIFYKRYILGLWCTAEGVIYDMFSRSVHVREMPPLPYARDRYGHVITDGDGAPVRVTPRRFVSCDYGTQNATVFLLWELHPEDGIWYCTREYYYSGRDSKRQKTDKEYADDLDAWLSGDRIEKVIVDPAAASFIAELRRRGYPVRKAKNDVLDGIRFVASLLSGAKICFSAGCEGTLAEFPEYIWDRKAADRGEDKPVKVRDHGMDAVRYFCYTVLARGARYNPVPGGGL